MNNEDDVVLVAVAINDVQAIVYRKLLEASGIQVALADFDDLIVGEDVIIGKSIQNVKVIVAAEEADRAKEIIAEFESRKDTKVTSKSGAHLLIRCEHCNKYLSFPSKDKGTTQICPECLKIIELPEQRGGPARGDAP